MDQAFTDFVINAMGPKTTPRMRRILGSLIQHVHDFLRENSVTTDEWLEGVKVLNSIGQKSDEKRDEGILICDVIGIEALVDSITHHLDDEDHTGTAIIGPFYRDNSPVYKSGESIIQKDVGGDKAWVHGKVIGANGAPIKGAKIEVWHTAPNGLYEQQDPDQPEYNLRGTFYSDDNGNFSYICLRPTAYPIPFDGPAGRLLQIMDRHPWRPSHIHWRVTAPGYRDLITQIYDSECKYVKDDSVFAVKDDLVVEFKHDSPGAKEHGVPYELDYNITLITSERAEKETAKRIAAQKAKEKELEKAAQVYNETAKLAA
jgi:catechol 1,2-dioxygenase